MIKIRKELLAIATGRSRREKYWKNENILWSDLLERLGETHRTNETCEEYKNWNKSKRDDVKDIGGFVGGALIDGRRKSGNVKSRQIITLDADFVQGNLWSDYVRFIGYGGAMYSTHSHNPEKPG